ncbi:unnamed protein product, partial [Rotaria sordida]
ASLEIALRKKTLESGHVIYIGTGAFWGAEDIDKMNERNTLRSLCITMKKHPDCYKLNEPLRSKLIDERTKHGEQLGEIVIYSGPVRELCQLAPNNVNTMAVGAIIASNLGFDRVQGCLIADTSLYDRHIVEIELTGPEKTIDENKPVKFHLKTIRTNPAEFGVVTGTATLLSFISSIKRAKEILVSVPSYADVNVSSWVTDEGLNYIDSGIAYDVTLDDMHQFSLMDSQPIRNYLSFVSRMAHLFHSFNRVAYETLLPQLRKKSGTPRVIIFDLNMLWAIDLAEQLGSIPAIVVCPFLIDALDLPSMTPHWHTPSYIVPYSPSTFFGRIQLFFYRSIIIPYQKYFIFSHIYQRKFDYEYLIKKHYLSVFVSTAPPFEIPRSVINPAIHFLGPFVYEYRLQPIHHNLLLWLNDIVQQNDTLIYISLGSIGLLTQEQSNKLIYAFMKLIETKTSSQIRILWARGNTLKSNDSRFRLEGFVPQKTILSHPAMQQERSIYINHCGMSSMHESIVFGIPQIAFPLFLDQYQVAKRSVQLHMGLYIDKNNFTSNELIEKILLILNNPHIYRRNTKKIADSFRIYGNGLKRAQNIIEYMSKYGRDIQKQIVSYDSQMNWIEKYSLDILICFLLFIFIMFILIRITWKILILIRKEKKE